MANLTATKLAEMIKRKLSHNFGVIPEDASDELFYKACVLVLLDIMRERRTQFRQKVSDEGAKTIYYLSYATIY